MVENNEKELEKNENVVDSGKVEPERELEVREPIVIEDGVHEGDIVRVEYRDEPYKYLDLFIKLKDKDIELKAGYPQIISSTSSLGRLLQRFSVNLLKGEKLKPYFLLVNKKVRFQTITETIKIENRNVDFARIIRDSIKPL